MTNEQKAEFRRMWDVGSSPRELGERFGVSRAEVYLIRERLGCKNRNPADLIRPQKRVVWPKIDKKPWPHDCRFSDVPPDKVAAEMPILPASVAAGIARRFVPDSFCAQSSMGGRQI